MDLGEPASYLTLREGTPVYASDGEGVGRVTHVLAAPEEDIFDGVVIDSEAGSGGHRFVDAPQVAEIHEDGVLLGIDAAAVASLPQPSENPAAVSAGPDATVPEHLHDKLKRAWDRVSGNY